MSRISGFKSVAVLILICAAAGPAADLYVAQNGQTPGAGYVDWTTAASNIQDAVNAAAGHDVIWIGPGRYGLPAAPTNYHGNDSVVYVNRPLTLRGSNGIPGSVIIDGGGLNRGIMLYRSGSLTNRLVLQGLVVSNCYSLTNGAGMFIAPEGAAGWTVAVHNCVITGNRAERNGGGLYGYTTGWLGLIISNSVISHNSIVTTLTNIHTGGAGVYLTPYYTGSLLIYNSAIVGNTALFTTSQMGGGVYLQTGRLTLENTVFHGNGARGMTSAEGGVADARTGGGGLYLFDVSQATVRNCLFGCNDAYRGGAINVQNNGTAINLWLNNCTIVSNAAMSLVGGLHVRNANGPVNVINTIIYSNTPANIRLQAGTMEAFQHSCTTPTNGISDFYVAGNITNAPLFHDFAVANWRLAKFSPCINTGTNSSELFDIVDLDGRSRVDRISRRVDMGCYEYLPAGGLVRIY